MFAAGSSRGPAGRGPASGSGGSSSQRGRRHGRTCEGQPQRCGGEGRDTPKKEAGVTVAVATIMLPRFLFVTETLHFSPEGP